MNYNTKNETMDEWEKRFLKEREENAKRNSSFDRKPVLRPEKIKTISFDEFSPSQKNAYTEMMNGYNCFLTGMAGTGKTTLINKFVSDSRNSGKTVAVTGSTGISAENIGGVTIHSFLGIPWNDLNRLILKRWGDVTSRAKSLIRNTDILIIDEISMIDYVVFEYICFILTRSNVNRVKKGLLPTQLIVSGDFLQLPPVVSDRKDICVEYYPDYEEGFCFESRAWKDMKFHILNLSEVLRQNEKEYIDALKKLKTGDTGTVEYFNRRYNPALKISNQAVFLFGTNSEALKRNADELEKINKPKTVFENSVDVRSGYQGKVNLAFQEVLELKPGARVISLVNDTEGKYKNGSLGTVTAIDKGKVAVAFDNGKVCTVEPVAEEHFSFRLDYSLNEEKPEIVKEWQYTEKNIPLKLAYALTIHKSQGQTFENVVVSPSCFASGQLYVALSRCRTFDGIYLLRPITPADIRVSESVIRFEKENSLI